MPHVLDWLQTTGCDILGLQELKLDNDANQKYDSNHFDEWYGTGNGYQFTSDVNSYLVDFFDHYLKNKPSSTFTNYTALNKSSLMFCGNGKGKIVAY